MKRTVLIAATILLFSGLTAGVVGYNGSEDGPHIMSSGSSSSASSSTSVGPNGTEWTAEVSMAGRSSTNISDTVHNTNFSDQKQVSFEGQIVAPTPCHILDHEVTQASDSSYILNIKTVKDELDNQSVCTQVLTGIDYEASFETDTPFKLDVKHNNQSIKVLTSPGYEEEDTKKNQQGLLEGFINWLRNLF